ncbi:ThiF family adenylyltransferase [Draconibacterium orientale]|uniref:ThiF family adenylyltransferase n=1 Tax=Draconibacterium orientale TaxID=1168034 RepID=UPI0029BFEBD7|nr:ThiF family adenylyltransferase [Draconibacterium orientale]
MYRRNYLYITSEQQEKIKNYRIIIGGCGLGSVIAECALRLGFEDLCIIDGDKVELSNLNRQNYTRDDIGKYKVDALQNRLLQINPNAKITTIGEYLTPENIDKHLNRRYDLAINTIDFTSHIPFLFDKICVSRNIPVLHPLNLGWGASVIIIDRDSKQLSTLHHEYEGFELHMAQHILLELKKTERLPPYLIDIISDYSKIKGRGVSPPQLAVGSWLVASMCTTLMYNLCVNVEVKTFPEVYFKSI